MKKDENHIVFKEWYDQYFSFVYLFLVGYFANRGIHVEQCEIEDLVQNTFLALLERKTNRTIEYPLAYLKKTAISQARLFIEKKHKRNIQKDNTALLEQIAVPPCPAFEQKNAEQHILHIIEKILNPIESKLIFQRIVKGFSYREIAQQDDMPKEEHLYTLLHRAKSKLLKHWKNQ
ncbi:MAG TPA: sigma-70 family RNA polymerase sigma factor [Phaeodactylibacter sp.]|nr:sigma-70 family RNA polymerase sigma factor [Phaeodactylibacter sp.]